LSGGLTSLQQVMQDVLFGGRVLCGCHHRFIVVDDRRRSVRTLNQNYENVAQKGYNQTLTTPMLLKYSKMNLSNKRVVLIIEAVGRPVA
jgi:hypothetical protein